LKRKIKKSTFTFIILKSVFSNFCNKKLDTGGDMKSSQTKNVDKETMKFDVSREMAEFRNQISLIKRIGFFFGAGSSMEVGIPGITQLTSEVKRKLNSEEQKTVKIIEESIQESQLVPSDITIEDVLNQIRLIRQITKDSKTQSFKDICGEQAKNLDLKICRTIYEIISTKERDSEFEITKKLLACINWFNREYTKEIFTTNYDLIFEKSFESLQIPYFDGFIGANEPFFLPESIETGSKLDYPPISWVRLWKLHGSLGWFWKKNDKGYGSKVIRLGVRIKDVDSKDNELVIYPSREKYELSRKQPFISYFDRLKRYLLEGEEIFIISGYSFSDEHINEIFFNALQQNNRLHIITFLYNADDMERVRQCYRPFLNFTAYSPSSAIISGNYGDWDIENQPNVSDSAVSASYWDETCNQLSLGKFSNLVNFFVEISGKRDRINLVDEGKL
jgi:hypothetical protein